MIAFPDDAFFGDKEYVDKGRIYTVWIQKGQTYKENMLKKGKWS